LSRHTNGVCCDGFIRWMVLMSEVIERNHRQNGGITKPILQSFELSESFQKLVDINRGADQSEDEADEKPDRLRAVVLVDIVTDQCGHRYHPRNAQRQPHHPNCSAPACGALLLVIVAGHTSPRRGWGWTAARSRRRSRGRRR